MRKSKFTEEQMAYALKQAELGISTSPQPLQRGEPHPPLTRASVSLAADGSYRAWPPLSLWDQGRGPP